MNKKLLISETEKNKILSLYGLLTEEVGPEESVVIDRVNPYNHPQYKNFIRPYSKDLKDGDIFVNYEKPCKTFGKLILNSFGSESRKTIRIYDEIKTIDFIYDYQSHGTPGKNDCPTNGCEFAITVFSTEGSDNHLSKDSEDITYYKNGNIKYGYGSGEYGRRTLENENLKSFLDKNLKKFFDWSSVPDECFEIRKIQRTKTDFK